MFLLLIWEIKLILYYEKDFHIKLGWVFFRNTHSHSLNKQQALQKKACKYFLDVIFKGANMQIFFRSDFSRVNLFWKVILQEQISKSFFLDMILKGNHTNFLETWFYKGKHIIFFFFCDMIFQEQTFKSILKSDFTRILCKSFFRYDPTRTSIQNLFWDVILNDVNNM